MKAKISSGPLSDLDLLIRNGWGDVPGPFRSLALSVLRVPGKCPRCSAKMWHRGYKAGRPDLRCRSCGWSRLFNRRLSGTILPPEEICRLGVLYLTGIGARPAARHMGRERKAVGRVYRIFERVHPRPICACGRPADHGGYCCGRREQQR